jgi:hypothetical protein
MCVAPALLDGMRTIERVMYRQANTFLDANNIAGMEAWMVDFAELENPDIRLTTMAESVLAAIHAVRGYTFNPELS